MTNVASQIDISKAESIPGWMTARELVWLANMASKCNTIVEFGSFHGRSTRALADHCDGVVYAVDPWNGDYPNEAGGILEQVNTYVLPDFIKNLKDHVDSGRVIPIRGFSYSFNLDHYVDMVFLDGDHRYTTVLKDIEKALLLLKLNGIICGHDYNHSTWPGVKKAVDLILGPIEIEDTIWWTRKS